MAPKHERGRPAHPDILTPAEWRVLEAVRHGLTNPQIATRMAVSTDAVKYHVGNTLQKLGFSSRASLRRWDGIRRDSPLFRKEPLMSEPKPLGRIGQIGRTVQNIASSRQWYEEVLGLLHLYSFGNFAFFDCGGVRLFLSEGEGGAAQSMIYFRVDDIRMAHATLSERGVTFINAPHLVHRHENGTEEWMAFFTDNEDRPLAIMAQVDAG